MFLHLDSLKVYAVAQNMPVEEQSGLLIKRVPWASWSEKHWIKQSSDFAIMLGVLKMLM